MFFTGVGRLGQDGFGVKPTRDARYLDPIIGFHLLITFKAMAVDLGPVKRIQKGHKAFS